MVFLLLSVMLIGPENHFYVCRFCAARENLTHAAEVRLYAAKKQNTAIESARGTSPWTARQPAGKGKVPKLDAGYRQTMVFFTTSLWTDIRRFLFWKSAFTAAGSSPSRRRGRRNGSISSTHFLSVHSKTSYSSFYSATGGLFCCCPFLLGLFKKPAPPFFTQRFRTSRQLRPP